MGDRWTPQTGEAWMSDTNKRLDFTERRGNSIPERLGYNSMFWPAGTDLDDIIATGWHRGSNLLHTPGGSAGWFFVEVISHSDLHVTQIAHAYARGAASPEYGKTYKRTKNGSTWEGWIADDPVGMNNSIVALNNNTPFDFNPDGAGTRQYMRLGRVDGGNASSGANWSFIIAGDGNYGAAARASILVHVSQRGADAISLRAWSFGGDTASTVVSLYTKKISTYVFEVWGYFAPYSQMHTLTNLARQNMTLHLDSKTPTAPSGLSSAYNIEEVLTQIVPGQLDINVIRLLNTGDVSPTSTTHAFQIGLSTGANLAADQNEIMARTNGAVSALFLNTSGGDVGIGNASSTVSISGRLNSAHTSWAQASGQVALSLLANGANQDVAITFPAGRFTQPPNINLTSFSTRYNLQVTDGTVTASGFTLRASNFSGAAASGASKANWQAMQMTSGSANG